MNFIGIIPARYASTRFPGKPLADIGGKPMIQRVYEQASKALDAVLVATDHERIENAVKKFNGNVILTDTTHKSGTDRCAEAVLKFSAITKKNYDVVINIQGDEPFINPQQIQQIIHLFNTEHVDIATLATRIKNDDTLNNHNIVKVVINHKNQALYFSRYAIPFIINTDSNNKCNQHTFYQHIGLYAYKTSILQTITQLPQSSLEKAESLEQLRWLEHGYKINVAITEHGSIAIDTKNDIDKIKHLGLI